MTEPSAPTRWSRRGPVPLKTYLARVNQRELVTPRMLRLTIGGGDLAAFVSAAADQFITLILPQPGQERPLIDPATFTWEQYRTMPEASRPIVRNYTVRRHRPEMAELDVDVVLHGHGGPASNWARQAQPGDHLAIWGPRMAYNPPAETDWLLLCGDETAIPAIGAILDDLPAGARVRAFIEVTDADDEQPLNDGREVSVTWLHRDGVAAGQSTCLVDALRATDFPLGQVYAWGGGERRMMAAVRQHLQEERGIPTGALSIISYWRHDDHDD